MCDCERHLIAFDEDAIKLETMTVVGDLGLGAFNLAASPVRPGERNRLAGRMMNTVVMWRCTDRCLTATLLAFGSLASFLLLLSVGSNQWLYINEPLFVNKTDPKKNYWEVVFLFTSGYWKACRERLKLNETALDSEHRDYFMVAEEMKPMCSPNVFFTGNEALEQISKATVAILNRIQLSAIFHIFSLILCVIATIMASLGYFQTNIKTLYSGILFICSGMLICIAILQYICVVDDEMTPRMKPTPQGDASKFTYTYGYAFFVGSSCFIMLQICAVGFLTLFMRRFPGLEDKMKIVPGLKDKVRSAYLDREGGQENIIGLDSVKETPLCGMEMDVDPVSKKERMRRSFEEDIIVPQFQSPPVYIPRRRGSYGHYATSPPSKSNLLSTHLLKDVLDHEDRCPLNSNPLVFYDEV